MEESHAGEKIQTKIKMQFDPDIAKDIGVECAIMYANIEFWVEFNAANNKHFYEERYWTYNSQEAYVRLFSFWSRRQIQRILKKLIEAKYILLGNFNDNKYNQTKWYTVLRTTIAPNRAMDSTE